MLQPGVIIPRQIKIQPMVLAYHNLECQVQHPLKGRCHSRQWPNLLRLKSLGKKAGKVIISYNLILERKILIRKILQALQLLECSLVTLYSANGLLGDLEFQESLTKDLFLHNQMAGALEAVLVEMMAGLIWCQDSKAALCRGKTQCHQHHRIARR